MKMKYRIITKNEERTYQAQFKCLFWWVTFTEHDTIRSTSPIEFKTIEDAEKYIKKVKSNLDGGVVVKEIEL